MSTDRFHLQPELFRPAFQYPSHLYAEMLARMAERYPEREAVLYKVLFGSDYPLITPDRWLEDFKQLPIRPEVRPLILKENAVKLLCLNTS
jgi:predicted TIM-barrel fold metal-dependent hydrolase